MRDITSADIIELWMITASTSKKRVLKKQKLLFQNALIMV